MSKITKGPSLSISVIQEREIAHLIQGGGKFLNLGSKDKEFSDCVINLDLIGGRNVDVVGDAHNLPFNDNEFDGVIITGVLEIVENPQRVVSEIFRVLKHEGKVLATLPFLQPYHPDPTDCYRYTREGVRNLFAQFEMIKLCNARGIFSMMCWIMRHFLANVLSFNNMVLWKIWYVIWGWLIFPFKYLDYIAPDYKRLYFISSGFLYIGKKL